MLCCSAIHDAAGDWLYEECRQLNGAKAGEVKVTRGYRLPAKYVFHAVGPVGKRPKELRACYDAALQLALDHKVRAARACVCGKGVFSF
jgi:O-acetyl-ADP-ribose deacetylase (regulator of RNase III)